MEKLSVVAVLIAVALFLSFIFSFPAMLLWNYCLVGTVEGIKETSWLNMWGICILFNILFKTNVTKKD